MTQTRYAALIDESPAAFDKEQLEQALARAADDGWPAPVLPKPVPQSDASEHRTARTWEYLISALPRFAAPTQSAHSSAAVRALNDLGAERWEAVGMTVLVDGTVAVLLKRPVEGDRAS